MKRISCVFLCSVALAALVCGALKAGAAGREIVRPFETDTWSTPGNEIDALVLIALRKRSLQPAPPCSDEVFVRRVYLDVIGTLPEPAEVKIFLDDRSPDKRARLIDALLKRDEFADYWSMKWCDLLRVKSEFPVNLWPNAVQAYHRWIRDALRENKPYDQFARELLTSSGSNFRTPPVNFYRAVPGRDPASLAAAVALTFMGTRLENWPASRRTDLALFFTRVAYKKTAEWKEEIVYCRVDSAEAAEAVFPDGTATRIPSERDPRAVFADWLIKKQNPWFAANIVNRVWFWLLGRGIVHEPDDIRPNNPAANPALLAYLERELVKAHYDLRHIYRLVLNSRTYQQSCIPAERGTAAGALSAYYQVRRLEAEVLLDALDRIGDTGEDYMSVIPEPYTFIPERQRSILLADGSITSPFLDLFGRSARDTGQELERNNLPTVAQQIHLLNSSDVQRKIERSPRVREILKTVRWKRGEAVRGIYLLILSRYPTESEAAAVEKYAQDGGVNLKQATDDLAWALVNSKEFLYRH